jgi:hypothetical protein
MLDNSEKTQRLLQMLEAALPFEADLTSEAVEALKRENSSAALLRRQEVVNISYAGDEGGIMCHMQPENDRGAIVASITHLRLPAHLPFAAAVVAYQKHRVKKLRKLRGDYRGEDARQ